MAYDGNAEKNLCTFILVCTFDRFQIIYILKKVLMLIPPALFKRKSILIKSNAPDQKLKPLTGEETFVEHATI